MRCVSALISGPLYISQLCKSVLSYTPVGCSPVWPSSMDDPIFDLSTTLKDPGLTLTSLQ